MSYGGSAARYNRSGDYRSVFRLTIFSAQILYFSLTLGLGAASAQITKSDAELSHALVGTWEFRIERRAYPITKSFISYDASGTFKSLKIVDVLGYHGRVQGAGPWRVAGGKLISKISDPSSVNPVSYVDTEQIISLNDGVLLLRDEDGEEEEGHKSANPTQLPPLLPPQAFDKLVTQKLILEYPVAARPQRMQGSGAFKVFVDEKTGAVRSIRVLQTTGHKILDEAAIRGLKKWRFRPGTVRRTVVPIYFKFTHR